MISAILHKITSILNDNIRLQFNLKRDIVKIQSVDNDENEGYIGVSVINIERDASGGIAFNRRDVSLDHSSKSAPTWQVSIYVLIAAVFPKKKYAESLKLITEMLRIIQSNHILVFDDSGIRYTAEPINTTFQELSNIWSVSGGTYYPSIICKIKSLEIDGGGIIQIDPSIKDREIDL